MEEYKFKNNNYSRNTISNLKRNKYAKISFILSIIGIILSPIFLFQILGLIFGIKSLSSEKRGLSKKGILISIVAIFLGIAVVLMLIHIHHESVTISYIDLSITWVIVSPIFGLFLFQTLGLIFGISGLNSEKGKFLKKHILLCIVVIFLVSAVVIILIRLNYQMAIIGGQQSGISTDYFNLSIIGIIVSPIFGLFLFQSLILIFGINGLNFKKRGLSKKVVPVSIAAILGIVIIFILIDLNYQIEQERISYDYVVAGKIESGIRLYMIHNEDYELELIIDETLDIEKLLTDLYERSLDNNKPYLRKKFSLNTYPASRLYKGWDILVDSENVIVEVKPSPEGHSLIIK